MTNATADSWWDIGWSWFTTATPIPVLWAAVAAAAAGAIIATYDPTWRRSRLLATWIHEAGHAFVAMLTGRNVSAIRLTAGSGGVTEHVGAAHGFGRILTAAAGYPAPAVVSAFTIWTVLTGHASWAIAGFVISGIVLLPFQRSWRGLLVTVLGGALMLGLLRLDPQWSVLGLTVIAGYLAAASPRTIVELHRARQHHEHVGTPPHSDADTLAALTRTPPTLWETIFMVASIAAPAAAVWLALNG